ncbi:hypothetical protein AVEN_82528-1 [Araneus ventricosus]|uniref:Uncharacterized protein n=1 Tax=Araneus ventricosus TaxID=182803 RepID=A0A4Y2GMV0_ARAVE|nr:hypothetical protein AVEN_82528-1 [Araneus ventricosus]
MEQFREFFESPARSARGPVCPQKHTKRSQSLTGALRVWIRKNNADALSSVAEVQLPSEKPNSLFYVPIKTSSTVMWNSFSPPAKIPAYYSSLVSPIPTKANVPPQPSSFPVRLATLSLNIFVKKPSAPSLCCYDCTCNRETLSFPRA